VKYRLAILIGAIGIIVVGILLYVNTGDNFAACASAIGGLVRAFDPASARDCANVNTEHYGSIAIMILGGVILLSGWLPRKKST
jgi:hypothetical protein